MTIVRCPRCRDEVTVPPRASGVALVRCPLCLEQYLLSEALAQAPPALIMVSESVRDGFAPPAVEAEPEPTGDDYVLADGGGAESSLVNTATRDAVIAAA